MKIKETVQKLLKKTKNVSILKEIELLLEEELKKIPNIDFANIGEKTESVLR